MADYTYATSAGKRTYDEWIEEARARAARQAETYAAQASAANESYRSGVNAMYDARIKAREAAAAAETEKTRAAYHAQFDANAASKLAGERRLQEQMANYGLTKSGYNATNQTALAVARSNADAATRIARGQAVDAIAADLRAYTAEAEAERAKVLAEGERATAERIMDTERDLLQNSHDETMDLMEHVHQSERDGVQDEQWASEQELKRKEAELELKKYVEAHNDEVYRLMLEAYKNGNAPLAETYAKTLWQVDENGVVSPLVLDTSAATEYTEQQNAFEKQLQSDEAEDAATDDELPTSGYDRFGFPYKFYDFITEARDLMHRVAQTGHVNTRKELTNRALNLLYMVRQETKTEGSEGYMDGDTFIKLLQYIGVTAKQYREYEHAMTVFLQNSDKQSLRVPWNSVAVMYDR